ncbi:MAG: type pilus assembly protein PilF [Candidatus Poribacteria bacterium]|nr:type pilus assembly protein PilF [Candidatus Poribacteria bacterium]
MSTAKISWGITPAERAELAYQEGQKLELGCKFQKSAEYYMEAVKQDKKNTQYQYKLAYAYTQLKPPKIKEAINQLKSLLKIDSKYKNAYSLLGRLYLQQGEFKKAETAFEKALNIDKKFAEPQFFLGELYRQENTDQAVIHYQAYLELVTQGEYIDTAQERLREIVYGTAGVQLNLAIATIRNREYERALTILNRLLQLKVASIPADRLRILQQEAHYWRGLLYSIPEAKTHYDSKGTKSEREWLMSPDIIAARVELGNWYYQISEVRDAIIQLEAVIRLASAPNYAGPYGKWLVQRAYVYLGKAYIETGQSQKALTAFQKAQNIDKEGEFALDAKAYSELLSGNRPTLVQLQEMTPDDPKQWVGLKERFLIEYVSEVKNDSLQHRLERILTRILTASSIQPFGNYPHSVIILKNSEAGAWSLPGGQIFISTGLLKFIKSYLQDSDDALAFIISHEIAHLVNHDVERSQEGIQVIKAAFAGGKLPLTALQHGLGRIAELRADKDGVLFAYRAKYNPTTALQWCDAVIETYGDIDPNGTYPTFKARREQLKRFLTAEIQVAYGKFSTGVNAFRKGDFTMAVENFSAYLAYFPYDKYAINNLGMAYYQQAIRKAGGSPHGEWRLCTGIELKSDLPLIRIRGNPPTANLDESILRKAIQLFETALQVDRNYRVGYKNLGDVYGDLGNFDEADKVYQYALNIDPNYTEALNNRGVLLCRRNQVGNGIQAFLEVLKNDKSNLEARYNLPLAYEYSSQLDKAQDTWLTYLKFDAESNWAVRAREHLELMKSK